MARCVRPLRALRTAREPEAEEILGTCCTPRPASRQARCRDERGVSEAQAGVRNHSSSSAISMYSPLESSSVQLDRGDAPDPKVDVAAGNPWTLRMAGSGGRLVSRLPGPPVRWS